MRDDELAAADGGYQGLLSEAILYAIVSYISVCQTLGLAYKWGVKVLLEDQCLLIFRTH